jgi:Kef-type K+ transport system membrane component KefB/nucleotide-binding universal stress UspA family protein
MITLPITDPVLIVAIAMAIFLTAPVLMRQLRLPGLIGIILAGVIIGPNALNLLARDQTIVLLGTVGLLYLMFLAGSDIDLQGFRRYRTRSLLFGSMSYLVPQGIGIAAGMYLGYPFASALLLGSMFGSHTLVAYPIAARFGIARNRAVTTAVGGTIVTDSTALLVLAVVAASTRGALDAAFWLRLGGMLSAYVALVWFGLPRLGRWFFRTEQTGPTAEYVFVLTALFSGAYLARVAGVEPIVGAFLVGLALNRLVPDESTLRNRLHFFGEAFFIPFFLLSIGMLVDVRVLMSSARAWEVMIGMVGAVAIGKLAAAFLAGRLFGYTREEAWTVFGLTVPQAAATLAATLIGLEIGLFDEAVLNGAVMMILVTCTIGPWALGRFGRAVALQDQQQPYDPADAPQRVLVPMANPATAGALLDLAVTIRAPGSTQALMPATVVSGELGRSAGDVALAERMLGEAVTHASGADVPVLPITRVDHNFAKGIMRAAAETRTTTIVIGWDGRPSIKRGVFGSVLDQLLELTRQEIMVAKLGHPLNTTERLLVLIPAGSDHVPGFHESVRAIKLMGSRLIAKIEAFAVGTPAAEYEAHFLAVKPEAPITVHELADWGDVPAALRATVRANDLVVALSARRGAVSWVPELDDLPGKLAQLLPESFVMIYPSELATPLPAREPVEPARIIVPGRVRFALDGVAHEEALDALLRSAFADRPWLFYQATEALLHDWPRALNELRPGVAVLHAPVPGIDEPMTFLGVSHDGLDIPGAHEPVRLLFLLLSSVESGDDHLRHLSEIARVIGDPQRLPLLLEARDYDALTEAFRAG